MEKENWIEAIINSTDGMSKAAPNEMLLFKIERRINSHKTISNNWIIGTAAVLVILFTINIEAFFINSKKSNGAEMVASSISKDNQFY
jgi:hypothetical protein